MTAMNLFLSADRIYPGLALAALAAKRFPPLLKGTINSQRKLAVAAGPCAEDHARYPEGRRREPTPPWGTGTC